MVCVNVCDKSFTQDAMLLRVNDLHTELESHLVEINIVMLRRFLFYKKNKSCLIQNVVVPRVLHVEVSLMLLMSNLLSLSNKTQP